MQLDPRLEELRKNLHNRDWLDGDKVVLQLILDTLKALVEKENASH